MGSEVVQSNFDNSVGYNFVGRQKVTGTFCCQTYYQIIQSLSLWKILGLIPFISKGTNKRLFVLAGIEPILERILWQSHLIAPCEPLWLPLLISWRFTDVIVGNVLEGQP